MRKDISISKCIMTWLFLSLTCYYATFTIMEGSIFNPLYEWMNNNYMVIKDTKGFSELLWEKITILFSCFHCLGTWTGLFISTVFTIIFGEQIKEIFLKFPNKPKTLIFKVCLTIGLAFCISAGSLGLYSIFNYPKHKLELIKRYQIRLLEQEASFLEEIEKNCNCKKLERIRP